MAAAVPISTVWATSFSFTSIAMENDPIADFDIGFLDRLFGAFVGRHLGAKTD
jgi:hypothetical protein